LTGTKSNDLLKLKKEAEMNLSKNENSSLEQRLQAAREEALKQIDTGLIQCAVFATGEKGPVVAVGKQCVKPHEKPITENSRFDIASVGKVFTAACCALLISDGKLDPMRLSRSICRNTFLEKMWDYCA
jgi:CubicO group peptidase (beta-lactamase class C family)